MADIIVKGYVNRPATKQGGSGSFSTFTLAERQKDKKSETGYVKVYWSVTDWNNATPPADGAFVTVKGYTRPPRIYQSKNGPAVSNEMVAQSIEVAPPRDGAARPRGAATQQNDWTKEADEEIPF